MGEAPPVAPEVPPVPRGPGLRAGYHGPPRPVAPAQAARDEQMRAMRRARTGQGSTPVEPESAAPPEQASSSSRKRRSDGDDAMRDELVRDEEFDYPPPDAPVSALSSSKALPRYDDGKDDKKVRFIDGQEEMHSVLTQGRLEDDMKVIRSKMKCKNDLSEVYSPPRVVTVAEAAGLRGGFSLDLTVPGPGGEVWDFSRKVCRDKALQMTREEKPYLLIGSPRAQHGRTSRI
jgi:hypothetical protein